MMRANPTHRTGLTAHLQLTEGALPECTPLPNSTPHIRLRMGSVTSRVVESDERIGAASWFVRRKTGLLCPPYWWVAVASFQVPFLTTYVYCRHSVARRHTWVVSGCATLLTCVAGFQVLACTSDPGIIPRGYTEENEEDEEAQEEHESEDEACKRRGQSIMGMKVKGRDRIVVQASGEPVVHRWCRTCQLHRPPRASHCPTLDCCVEEYDHFCPVVASCVGQRTLRYFVGYLTSCGLLASWTGWTTYRLMTTSCAPGGSDHSDFNGIDTMCASASIGCGAGVWSLLMSFLYVQYAIHTSLPCSCLFSCTPHPPPQPHLHRAYQARRCSRSHESVCHRQGMFADLPTPPDCLLPPPPLPRNPPVQRTQTTWRSAASALWATLFSALPESRLAEMERRRAGEARSKEHALS